MGVQLEISTEFRGDNSVRGPVEQGDKKKRSADCKYKPAPWFHEKAL
jgi:hypothetical protein